MDQIERINTEEQQLLDDHFVKQNLDAQCSQLFICLVFHLKCVFYLCTMYKIGSYEIGTCLTLEFSMAESKFLQIVKECVVFTQYFHFTCPFVRFVRRKKPPQKSHLVTNHSFWHWSKLFNHIMLSLTHNNGYDPCRL